MNSGLVGLQIRVIVVSKHQFGLIHYSLNLVFYYNWCKINDNFMNKLGFLNELFRFMKCFLIFIDFGYIFSVVWISSKNKYYSL